jgi:pimeloyl-ACP methyl ester carboxylesterase
VFVAVILALGVGRLDAQPPAVKNILLIHGTFADGSGWQAVFRILTAKGYNVTIVQNPCSSMEEDVAAVVRAMDRETGPLHFGGALVWRLSRDTKIHLYDTSERIQGGKIRSIWRPRCAAHR